MQQAARERKVSVPSVSKWRQRFALWGVRGLCDRARPGKPVQYDAAFRNRPVGADTATRQVPWGRSGGRGKTRRERSRRLACSARREGIYLQRRRSGCVSTEKEFAP